MYTSQYKEVNCTEPSPSVRLPWLKNDLHAVIFAKISDIGKILSGFGRLAFLGPML
jgi:hypothetical protein